MQGIRQVGELCCTHAVMAPLQSCSLSPTMRPAPQASQCLHKRILRNSKTQTW